MNSTDLFLDGRKGALLLAVPKFGFRYHGVSYADNFEKLSFGLACSNGLNVIGKMARITWRVIS
jgi:hypothetical protein